MPPFLGIRIPPPLPTPIPFPLGSCPASNFGLCGLCRVCPPTRQAQECILSSSAIVMGTNPSSANESQPHNLNGNFQERGGFFPLSLPSWSEECWGHCIKRVCLATGLTQTTSKTRDQEPWRFLLALEPTELWSPLDLKPDIAWTF